MIQRYFDVFLSAMALIVLSPVFCLVILVLRFSGEREIFYRQSRMGRNGEQFLLIKFATMLRNSPNMGTGTVTVRDDPRVLPVGKILRQTKLNELPQLINVLLGDMSLIGPRPLTSQTFYMYPEELQEQILSVAPGLSGLGSLVFRSEEKVLQDPTSAMKFYQNIVAPYKAQLELWYVENQSIYLYFKIMMVTLYVVLFRRSARIHSIFDGIPQLPAELSVLET